MKKLICIASAWLMFCVVGAASAQGQSGEGYTFITSERGPQICVGRWIPPTDVALAGVCEGQVYGLSQLSALSARQTVDRLDQLNILLSSMDQKLAVNNDLMTTLIQATVNTQAAIDQQVRQGGEILREAIVQRFNDLPKEILADDLFKDELTKLKEDILKEVEKQYSKRPTPTPK